jgi:hypothetical protein
MTIKDLVNSARAELTKIYKKDETPDERRHKLLEDLVDAEVREGLYDLGGPQEPATGSPKEGVGQ